MREPLGAEQVLIRWKQPGCCILDGRAFPRVAGEEDIVAYRIAKSWQKAGCVEILGGPEKIAQVLEVTEDL